LNKQGKIDFQTLSISISNSYPPVGGRRFESFPHYTKKTWFIL